MTLQIKYLVFKGISKKEEILFKSFLNLAKNDLDYKLMVLKSGQIDVDDPDILLMDENHEFKKSEQSLLKLPRVIVGGDLDSDLADYISRPVQWSEFKNAITSLKVDLTPQSAQSSERVLPTEVKLTISEAGEKPLSEQDSTSEIEEQSQDFSAEGDYEYELDKMSVDYQSFTNSDYIKVVDDVKQFNDGDADSANAPVILMTDDESASANSVLVLETNSMDAWDFNSSELSLSGFNERKLQAKFDESVTEEIELKQRAGFEVHPDEEYWLEDNEIIIDNHSFLFIKTARKMVYSTIEPGRWPNFMQRGSLFKVPLEPDWRPQEGLNVYPLNSLLWVNTLTNQTAGLMASLEENQKYLLMKWPSFDLLELDNVLLKLCTMLFVQPESVASLASKSGYARSTIRGLMNACHQMGYLVTPDQVAVDKMAPISAEDGMLGKIKDVFR